MRFPIQQTSSLALYILKKRLAGEHRFPIVLMLEPLHACNLTCTGCGRIREYQSTIHQMMSVKECLKSVEECGAPIVSICGGEPLIYPEIGRLTREILNRKKIVYLCTNAMFLPKKIDEFTPSSRFFFNVHLDGLEETHDLIVERKGVFRMAIEAIKLAKQRGFLVCTNTTIYRETDMREIEKLWEYLTELGVDGFMVSPAYPYDAVKTEEIFLTRQEIYEKFKEIDRLFKKFRLMSSPIYLEFLQGKRKLSCSAWGNPTRNTWGWKAPCYLITEGHYATFKDYMEKVDWSKYGPGKDPRCEHCMVHVGFEPTAALGVNKRLGDTFKMLAWQLL